jgi:hypothetical protein
MVFMSFLPRPDGQNTQAADAAVRMDVQADMRHGTRPLFHEIAVEPVDAVGGEFLLGQDLLPEHRRGGDKGGEVPRRARQVGGLQGAGIRVVALEMGGIDDDAFDRRPY